MHQKQSSQRIRAIGGHNTAGNLANKGGVNYTYSTAHPHAVSGFNGNGYDYDANGNQVQREIGADTFDLAYDAENRLVEVRKNSIVLASFLYDGDGRRVKSTINGLTTTFVGNYYEISGTTATKYYYAGATRVAMRTGSSLYYLLGDHLGSTSLTTDANGVKLSELRYTAWGDVRYQSGSTPTRYTYTGQYSNTSDFGLMFYNARWYDPYLNHFTQPDSIIPDPGNTLDWNRYSYARYNPIKFTDPSGHDVDCGIGDSYCSEAWQKYYRSKWKDNVPNYSSFKSFLHAKDHYEWYITHPSEALDAAFGIGNNGVAPMSYGWADIYSQLVENRYLQPYSDGMVAAAGEKARGAKDAETFYATMGSLALADYLADQYGTGGATWRGTFPTNSSSKVLYRETDGSISAFAVYDDSGEAIFRVDLTGRAHGGVSTPHMHYAKWNVDPATGKKYFGGWGNAMEWKP